MRWDGIWEGGEGVPMRLLSDNKQDTKTLKVNTMNTPRGGGFNESWKRLFWLPSLLLVFFEMNDFRLEYLSFWLPFIDEVPLITVMQIWCTLRWGSTSTSTRIECMRDTVTVCHIPMRRIEGEFAVLVGCAAPHPGHKVIVQNYSEWAFQWC